MMNLNPLYELKERLESSVIAGVSLIPEDFRLARAVEQLEPLSQASPVFLKIYQACQKLLSEGCEHRGAVLLDILGLVDAVLTTQAASSVEGELETLELVEGEICSDAPYSLLAPVLEALSTPGGGRYNLVMEAHENHPEIFADYRLKSALVAGLNASYSEMADQIQQWLCQEDTTILPLLKKGFDPKGKKEMARRVRVIETLAGAGENDWYLSMLDDAERDIRAALIYALRHSQDNREMLIGLTKTERGNSKKAALWSLARMEGTENIDFWEQQIQKNPADTAKYLALSTSDAASDLIADAIALALDDLAEQAGNGNLVLSNKDHEKLQRLFAAMIGKSSPKMMDLYRRAASDSLLELMKTKDHKSIEFDSDYTYYAMNDHTQMPVAHYLAELLMESMIWNPKEELYALAEELYQGYGERFLKPALTAALLTKGAAETYDTFSVPLMEDGGLKKESKNQRLARIEIMNTFAKVAWNDEKEQYELLGCYYDEFRENQVQIRHKLYEKPDIRWFELFVNPDLKKTGVFHTFHYTYYDQSHFYNYITKDWEFVLQYFVCPLDQEICGILGKYFYQRLRAAPSIRNCKKYFPYLRKCGFQDGKGILIQAVKKERLRFWELKDMLQSSPMRLSEQVEELEEMNRQVADKTLTITGWSEDGYQDLRTVLLKEMQEQ